MEGEDHTLLVFVKHQEMALYHKAWPNHVIVGLPTSADNQGIGAARYYIKVFNTSLWKADLGQKTEVKQELRVILAMNFLTSLKRECPSLVFYIIVLFMPRPHA